MFCTLAWLVYSWGFWLSRLLKDWVHANHRKTDLEMVPEDLTVDVQGMRVGSAVHFSLGLLLQNPYRGYIPLYLLPPFHYILVASGRPGTLFPAFQAAEVHYKQDL